VLSFFQSNVLKTIINHRIFDGLDNPLMVILGMVYFCFNHITLHLLPCVFYRLDFDYIVGVSVYPQPQPMGCV
jgi:hypothetical protein